MAGLRVLQIEDSESDADQVLRLLERAGYQVHVGRVENGEQLSAALEAGAWDIVVCGCELRQVDALKALAAVQASGLDIPFILVCRTIGEEAAVRLMKSGAHDYVTKDNLARLVPAIEREMKDAASRRRGKDAVEALRASEERLTLALAASKMGVWEWDLKTNAVYWSAECHAIAKFEDFDGTLDASLRLVDPEDLPRVWRTIESALAGKELFAAEFRVPGRNEIRWLSGSGKAIYDAQGQPSRLIGTIQEISARKEAEGTLRRTNRELEELAANYRSLLGQLNSVREEERAHLAREIHDQLGQTLTTLKLNSYSVEQALLGGAIPAALEQVRNSVANIDALIQSVRNIAIELRPPLLDQIGLAAALEWLIERFSKQHGVRIVTDLPPVEPDLSELQRISIFRIVQESLTNIIRHAGSQSANVSLREEVNSVRLTIEDVGTGFVASDHMSGSLGIFGMRERASLISASFSIQRNAARGTTVELIIPKGSGAGSE